MLEAGINSLLINTRMISLDHTIVITTTGIHTTATYLSASWTSVLISFSFLLACKLDIAGNNIPSIAKATIPINKAIL